MPSRSRPLHGYTVHVLANTGYVALYMVAAVTTPYAAEECVHYPSAAAATVRPRMRFDSMLTSQR